MKGERSWNFSTKQAWRLFSEIQSPGENRNIPAPGSCTLLKVRSMFSSAVKIRGGPGFFAKSEHSFNGRNSNRKRRIYEQRNEHLVFGVDPSAERRIKRTRRLQIRKIRPALLQLHALLLGRFDFVPRLPFQRTRIAHGFVGSPRSSHLTSAGCPPLSSFTSPAFIGKLKAGPPASSSEILPVARGKPNGNVAFKDDGKLHGQITTRQ